MQRRSSIVSEAVFISSTRSNEDGRENFIFTDKSGQTLW